MIYTGPVCCHADHRGATHGHERKGKPVVAGDEFERRRRHRHEPRTLPRIAGGIFDTGHILNFIRQFRQRRRIDFAPRSYGNVVDHHRQRGSSTHRTNVRIDASLRRAVVIRAHRENAGNAELCRLFGEMHRVRCVVRACARDDRNSHGFDNRVEQ